MRVLRFTPKLGSDLGNDPLFGVLEEDEKTISVITGDPLFNGIQKSGQATSLDDVRLLAPVLPRSKVVCVGKNYSDHAKEMGGEVPAEPIIFLKPNTSVAGPNDVIHWPWMSERVDHEAELAIVIGRICKDVPRERASEVIFGYTIGNDVTARDLQSRDGQWTRAKGFDTFCPLGPWIDTDFIPGNQEITCTVNGEVKQKATLNHGPSHRTRALTRLIIINVRALRYRSTLTRKFSLCPPVGPLTHLMSSAVYFFLLVIRYSFL